MIQFHNTNALQFLTQEEVDLLEAQVSLAHNMLEDLSGPGSDYLGWLHLSENYDKEEFARILEAAKRIQDSCDVFICAGIGGSYLGAKAAIDAISKQFRNAEDKNYPEVIFCGNQISSTYMKELMDYIKDKEVCVNVISKSGTTTETAIAFRILKNYIEERYGKEEAKNRIYATTDKEKGALRTLCEQEGYESFVVPDNIGGRYSVMTAVGLLPIAVSGINIEEMMEGLAFGEKEFSNSNFAENPAYQYAANRMSLHRKGFDIEVLVNYEPNFANLTEWWKQLYGESEGKDQKGIFPAGVQNTTDLHSMGQFIQEGKRNLFETVIWVKEAKEAFEIPYDEADLDGLNYLSGRDMHEVNYKAMQGTVLAHVDGGVPNLLIELDHMDPFHFGALVYFFERACAISGYLNAINPFNQPGVEAYKKNMFALLGKPGFENEKEELEKRLSQ